MKYSTSLIVKFLPIILVFVTVISGVIARIDFSMEFPIKLIFRLFCFVLLGAVILLNIKDIKYKQEELFILIFSLILLVFFYKEDLLNFIYILIFIIVIRKLLNYEKLVKTLFNSTIASVLLIFIFLILGISVGEVWVHSSDLSYVSQDLSLLFDKPEEFRVRFNFGMNHPNSFAAIIVSLISLLFLMKPNRKVFFVNFIIAVITFYFTDSKNILYFMLCMYLVYFIIKYVKHSLVSMIKYTPIIFVILSIGLPLLLSNTVVNQLLSGRLTLWNSLYKDSSFTDFIVGKSIDAYTIDNGFIHILYAGGFLLLAYFIKQSTESIEYYYTEQKIAIVACIIGILIYNFVEAYLLRFENGATILLWWLIFTAKSEINMKSIPTIQKLNLFKKNSKSEMNG